jgi:hypothetical protein
MMDGRLVQDGNLYNLHIAYLDKNAIQAEDLLYQRANLFHQHSNSNPGLLLR